MFTRFIIFPALVITLILSFIIGIIAPMFAESGNEIAFLTSLDGIPDIYIADITHRNLYMPLTHDEIIDTCPRYSPDGDQIVYGHNFPGEQYLMNANGSEKHQIQSVDEPRGSWGWAWNPNGLSTAFQSNYDLTSSLYIFDMHTHEELMLVDDADIVSLFTSPQWLNENQLLFFRDNDLYNIDIHTQIIEQMTQDHAIPEYPFLAVSGDLVAISAQFENEIIILNTNDLSQNMIEFDGTIDTLDWSSDGSYIAVLASQFELDTSQIYIVERDSRNHHLIQEIDHAPRVGWGVQWSPNGRWLAIQVDLQIYILDAESGEIIRTLSTVNYYPCPDWRP